MRLCRFNRLAGPGIFFSIPLIEFSNDLMFARRINIALSAAKTTPRRVIIEVPARGHSDETGDVVGERWEQHLAVLLLDAFCLSF